MTKHRDLAFGNAFPESFVDALCEFISTHISPNAVLTVLNGTTIQLTATTDNGQVCCGINGRWRWITSSVQATHPGGAAGVYPLYATAADNSFALGPPEVDSTNYSFALAITAGTPGTVLYRQIGYVEWNGSAITNARLLGDDAATRGTLEPGDYILSASASRQGALLCDGASYLRTAYPALFNALGGASSPYGLPDGTHFNVPDVRGRVIRGIGTGTGLTARAAGQQGGSEAVTLSGAQSGVPAHTHPSGGTGSGSTGTGTTGASATGTGATGVDTPDHSHTVGIGMAAQFSTLVGPPSSVPSFGDANGAWAAGSSGASARHAHTIPALSIPGLSIPSLSVTITDPATPANSAAAASASHDNMDPWHAGYVFIKT